jgi:micrococcal nuclease
MATPAGWIGVEATEKVRLIGVNAPEISTGESRGEFFGEEAKRYTRHRLQNRVARLFFDVQTRDRYGRLLAYIYAGESFFNLELVAEGCAQVYTVPPNVRHAAAFLEAQRRAVQEERGLWRKREFDARPVIGNRYSLVYHRPGCAGLPAPSNQVLFKNEKEAVLAGFRHCKDCFSAAAQP